MTGSIFEGHPAPPQMKNSNIYGIFRVVMNGAFSWFRLVFLSSTGVYRIAFLSQPLVLISVQRGSWRGHMAHFRIHHWRKMDILHSASLYFFRMFTKFSCILYTSHSYQYSHQKPWNLRNSWDVVHTLWKFTICSADIFKICSISLNLMMRNNLQA